MNRIKAVFSKRNRVLLNELVRTDFKLRYQGSILGYAWSLLNPLLIFFILYFVFVKFLKIGNDVPHYAIYLLFGIVIWNFFVEMTMQSLSSIVARGDLIRKISIPRWIIILSTSISALINLLLNMIVIAIFMIFGRVPVSSTIIYLPLLLLEVYLLALGISLFLSAANVLYRDVIYIWQVAIQAGFYATPIIYPLSRITKISLQKIIILNPMGQIIQDARYSLVTHESITPQQVFQGGWLSYLPILFVLIILLAGLYYFRRQSKFFAENI
jgi:ABC-2 type transport system permease protein